MTQEQIDLLSYNMNYDEVIGEFEVLKPNIKRRLDVWSCLKYKVVLNYFKTCSFVYL